jgi:phosphomannomutase / phosphoglucomutase
VSIYKPCDIRGQAATELTPELYLRWGATLGGWAGAGSKFVVGGDTRASTPSLLAALAEGLCHSGVDCVQLGHVPTPMIHHAKRRLRAVGCAVVTASHNAAATNGLKWMIGEQPPGPEEVERLQSEAEKKDPGTRKRRKKGTRQQRAGVKANVSSKSARRSVPESACSQLSPPPRELDVSYDYVAWLQETWIDALRARLHVVIDPMHGSWAGRARRYLHAVFPECLISVLHDDPDPDFGGRDPDCSRPENLGELCQHVYRERADLGIALDGDGDRVALVDNQGIPLTAEETTCVLLTSYGRKLRGQPFVYDLKFSDRVPEAARRLGAEPLVERSGHGFLRARMRQTGAAFGAEISGHYFFSELDGGDDGLFTACRAIAFLARSGKPLDKLRRRCPSVYMTPDLRLPLPGAAQEKVLRQVRRAWSAFPQCALDGVRVDVPGGWALVRSSVTESALTFRFEAADWPGLDDLVERFCDSLPELGTALWARYEAALGR